VELNLAKEWANSLAPLEIMVELVLKKEFSQILIVKKYYNSI
jgi:hypothetical protein